MIFFKFLYKNIFGNKFKYDFICQWHNKYTNENNFLVV